MKYMCIFGHTSMDDSDKILVKRLGENIKGWSVLSVINTEPEQTL